MPPVNIAVLRNLLIFIVVDRIILGKLGQYYCWWCLDHLRCKFASIDDMTVSQRKIPVFHTGSKMTTLTLELALLTFINQIDARLYWWRHQMETFSALLALCAGNWPAVGQFPSQRPVTRGFDVFFDLRLNKRLSKQSIRWRLRRHRAHYDVIVMKRFLVSWDHTGSPTHDWLGTSEIGAWKRHNDETFSLLLTACGGI